ncbi:MAG: SBBP repeat-containing protein [Candidatus Cloacimonetes bacterium]|nr:SBBP repeat-containing protein [Candidatus Cloacimonadota bacterium]
MKNNILFIILLLINLNLFSQIVQEEWVNTIQDISGLDIELDEFNNVYVLTTNCTIIKYDPNGIEQWSVTYETSTGGETAVDLTVDNSNNIYITGSIYGIDSWHDIVTVKFDSDGNQLWEMIYQSPSWANTNKPIGIAIDNSGNVYVSGFSYYSTEFTGYCRCVTIKYNTDGTEEWISLYEPVYDNWIKPSGIVVDNSGAVYITGGDGIKLGQGINYYNFVTIKYNTDGIVQWDAFYYGNQYGSATGKDISLDLDNNVIITGDCWEPEGWEIITIKYNNNGNLIWDSHLATDPLGYSYTPVNIVIDFENNVIVTCDRHDEYQIVKYDQFGNELWLVDTIKPNDLSVDQEGNIYVTGYIDYTGNYDYNYATVKYTTAGTQEWFIQYNGVEDYSDNSKAITLDNSGNVYITGRCFSQNNDVSCVTIKYSQSTSVNQGNMIIQDNRLSNHPNPFNPTTTISFSISKEGYIDLSIHNIKGQKIKSLLSDQITAGEHSIVWNGEDASEKKVSSGIYLYKLNINGKTEVVKKCLLLK